MVLYGLVMVMALVKMCHVVETRVFWNMACEGGLKEIMLSRVCKYVQFFFGIMGNGLIICGD
ncbi:hypothetical protein M758_8G048800 [Ceratodon purpureus]|nr:hypothetical protein M758_8G048800 [Ceratodon purpureus]